MELDISTLSAEEKQQAREHGLVTIWRMNSGIIATSETQKAIAHLQRESKWKNGLDDGSHDDTWNVRTFLVW